MGRPQPTVEAELRAWIRQELARCPQATAADLADRGTKLFLRDPAFLRRFVREHIRRESRGSQASRVRRQGIAHGCDRFLTEV